MVVLFLFCFFYIKPVKVNLSSAFVSLNSSWKYTESKLVEISEGVR